MKIISIVSAYLIIVSFLPAYTFAQNKNEDAADSISGTKTWQVKVLSYSLSGITASGVHTRKIKEPFVAVSRDLISELPMGSYIELSDCPRKGIYKVMDKMGKRHFNTVDVYARKAKKGIFHCTCRPYKSN